MNDVVLLAHGSPRFSAVLEWLIAEEPDLGRPVIVGSGEEAVERASRATVALVHLGLPGRMNALQAVDAMKRANPDLAVIVLGADVPYLRAAADDTGADGFVDERAPGDEVLLAVRLVLGATPGRASRPAR